MRLRRITLYVCVFVSGWLGAWAVTMWSLGCLGGQADPRYALHVLVHPWADNCPSGITSTELDHATMVTTFGCIWDAPGAIH